MLVLTRRAGESIIIGDDVRVVVLDVRGETIRLGIEAPRSVQVHRSEVYAEVQAANAASALAAASDELGVVGVSRSPAAKPTPPRPRSVAVRPAPVGVGLQRANAPRDLDESLPTAVPAQVALGSEVPSEA